MNATLARSGQQLGFNISKSKSGANVANFSLLTWNQVSTNYSMAADLTSVGMLESTNLAFVDLAITLIRFLYLKRKELKFWEPLLTRI